jgi:shikimate kinase
MACSGKSTVGKILADKMGYAFFDTDDYIKEKYAINFRELISTDPDRFHSLEYEALIASGSKGDCIVSTGGRTYLNKLNKDYINRNGQAIFIRVSPWNLVKRFNAKERAKRALPFMRLPTWMVIPFVYWQRIGSYLKDSRSVDGNGDPQSVADDVFFLVSK